MFVPTLVDAANTNAQVLNARAMLARWDAPGSVVQCHCYGDPDPRVAGNARVQVTRLWRRHAWRLHYLMRYLRACDLVFYPGVYPMDATGIRLRRMLHIRGKVVMTFEGLAGTAAHEDLYSSFAGHRVYCDRIDERTARRIDSEFHAADHIIAISPFLARMAQQRWGNKVSWLPLGVDTQLFDQPKQRRSDIASVACVGRLSAGKRPEVFLSLASRYRQTRFTWWGEGPLRSGLIEEAQVRGLANLSFPGSISHEGLATELANAEIFVLPSLSEGVPKVTQEAAASGLAQVIFGHYESPTVVDGESGFVVRDDEAFFAKAGALIEDRDLARRMGNAGRAMARQWDWSIVAPQWQRKLLEIAQS